MSNKINTSIIVKLYNYLLLFVEKNYCAFIIVIRVQVFLHFYIHENKLLHYGYELFRLLYLINKIIF